jgi:hypothetical protein
MLTARLILLSCLFFASSGKAATASMACLADLEAMPAFLLENDTGAKDELAQFGQAHFDDALAKARPAAVAATAETCNEVLNAYLKSWRAGHLWVTGGPPPAAGNEGGVSPAARTPSVTLLSDKTALLTIPSFAGYLREPLAALLRQNEKALASRPDWIIDVRDNDGGDDTTYGPLLPWLLPDETEQVGAEWLATPANIEGQQKICALVEPGNKDCEAFMAEAVKRMRSVEPGSYVSQQDAPAITYQRQDPLEPRRPKRVAVLVGHGCGSACEQFLLTVRQSFTVKLLGRRSHGSLDYSNMRPHQLPSGQRLLWYATSRSSRLPGLPVDVAGIPPDIYFPEPADEAAAREEVSRTQHWLESGSFSR